MSTQTTSIIDVVADGLQRFCEMPPSAAQTLAKAIMCAAAESGHAGAEYYLPALSTLTRSPTWLADRNAEIRREFNGRNLKSLCRKHGLSRISIYTIVRRGA